MTPELQFLVYSSLLMVVQSFGLLAPVLMEMGFGYGLGNRDGEVTLPAWAERGVRAHRNMLENLIPFTALVLAAHVAGVNSEATARGAMLFFWGRLAFYGIYLAGIPYLRTVAFVVAFVGMLEFVRALLGA